MAHFRFFDLPRELQDAILWHTPAVYRFQPVHDKDGVDKSSYVPQGIWIRDGKLRYPWGTLLCVSRSFTRVVKDMMFLSENRFILSGNPELNMSWLTGQSSHHLDQVRKLDLLLEWNDLHAFQGQQLGPDTNGGYENKQIILRSQYEKTWEKLISMIPKYFRIPELHLTVDAAFLNLKLRYNIDQDGNAEEPKGVQNWENDTIRYRCIYWTIFYPLVLNKIDFARLASLHIYLPVHREEESKFEKLIMGSSYDSVRDHGKVKYIWRDPRLPHGFDEWKVFDYWYELTEDEENEIYDDSVTMYDANEFGWMRSAIFSED